MKISQRRCAYCRRWYEPDPRTERFQKSCSRKVCQRSRQRRKYQAWMDKNPDYGRYRKPKIRAWAKGYPNYWQHYRRTHSDYRLSEIRRARTRRLKLKSVAKQTAIRQMSVEKLRSVREIGPPASAKQTAIARRVEGIIDYLFWKELSAKQMPIASLTGSVP